MNQPANPSLEGSATLFGHPTGLYTLFFAEMWERFSFYGMRALLIFYMTKDFLQYGDSQAYTVYGAYTALVYMMPFFGGILADRLLGPRRAVVLGGSLMAAGHLLMTVRQGIPFFLALGLLICGNGFFKPNISTIVGSLYPKQSKHRDDGFTIFYMGINLGAAISPLLCGYIGETFGWHYGFGLATIGMLTGLAVFVAPTRVTQVLIMVGAVGVSAGLLAFRPDNIFSIGVNVFTALSLLAAGVVAWIALDRGGLPADAGQPARRQSPAPAGVRSHLAAWIVYLGTVAAIVAAMFLVSGFSLVTSDHQAVTLTPKAWLVACQSSGNHYLNMLGTVLLELGRPAGLVLLLSALTAFTYLGIETFRMDTVPAAPHVRDHDPHGILDVVLVVLRAGRQFGEQLYRPERRSRPGGEESDCRHGGANVRASNRRRRNSATTTARNSSRSTRLNKLRDEHDERHDPYFKIDWKVTPDDVGMDLANRVQEIPARHVPGREPHLHPHFRPGVCRPSGAFLRRGGEIPRRP